MPASTLVEVIHLATLCNLNTAVAFDIAGEPASLPARAVVSSPARQAGSKHRRGVLCGRRNRWTSNPLFIAVVEPAAAAAAVT